MDLKGEVYKYPTMSMVVDRDHLLELHRDLIDGLRAKVSELEKEIEGASGKPKEKPVAAHIPNITYVSHG